MLRSGRVISPKEDKTLPKIESEILTTPKQTTMIETRVNKGRDTVDQKDTENLIISSPPFPNRLKFPKPTVS